MARYDDFDYGEPENRTLHVKRQLAKIGLSLDDKVTLAAPLADQPSKPLPLFEPGFFVPDGGTMRISPELAAQLHYAPALHKPDLPEGGENEVLDADGYEGMRRG
jgi:hypothetical protein